AKAQTVSLVVTDLAGKAVQTQRVDGIKGQQKLELNTSANGAGFYFVHLLTEAGRVSQKFVVVR
ncbi:MAG: T9SS type A sorting domain-containing protein, partial [Bacteroidota bacterium]